MAKQKETIEEIMKKQLSMLENKDSVVKLEKQYNRDQKIIAGLKEREKLSVRTIMLFEKKLKIAKELVETNIRSVLEDIKLLRVQQFENKSFQTLLDKIQMTASDLINEINKLTFISDDEKNFLAGDALVAKQNLQSRYDKLKSDYNEKVEVGFDRKPGRPKKEDQSIVSGLKLNKKIEKVVDENMINNSKFDEIFYKSPSSAKKYVSAIPKIDESSFDFDEALNPDMSLSDIMSDIIGSDIKSDKKFDYLKDEKISKLESGEITKPLVKREIKEIEIEQKQKRKTGGIFTSKDIFGQIKDL